MSLHKGSRCCLAITHRACDVELFHLEVSALREKKNSQAHGSHDVCIPFGTLTPPCTPPETVISLFCWGNIYCVGLCCPSVIRTSLHCFPISANQSPVCIL